MTLVLPPIPGIVSGPNPPLQERDRPWCEYPVGTKARGCFGGHWLRVEGGWRWMGGTEYAGGVFPVPGAEAVGECVQLPAE